uniref:Uncharacterized protein n=1 Tax=Arundo donax TaxID=35708 RepID=A0A0A9H8U5_ARUDO
MSCCNNRQFSTSFHRNTFLQDRNNDVKEIG